MHKQFNADNHVAMMNKRSSVIKRTAKTALLEALVAAAADSPALEYACSTLRITLQDIGHSGAMVTDLQRLLHVLCTAQISDRDWNSEVVRFTGRNETELNRIYRDDYEAHRRRFFETFVFPLFPREHYNRVLDLGCGRGWVARWLLEWLDCPLVVAVDPVHLALDWNRATRGFDGRLRFAHVPLERQAAWFRAQQPFDAVFCSWVLHHSIPAVVSRTFAALRATLTHGAHIVVLEDAAIPGMLPCQNHASLFERWEVLGKTKGQRPSVSQFHAQVLLDYVAVRLLARYSLVDMDFHYRTSRGWDCLLSGLGFAPDGAHFIGLPRFRDIAVPQTVLLYRNIR